LVTDGYSLQYLQVTAVTGRLLNEKERDQYMNSAPVKVPQELYERLKQRVEQQGGTLQQALVDVLMEPQAELSQLRGQLTQVQQDLKRQGEALSQAEQLLDKLSTQLKALQDRIVRLWTMREEDIKAFNSWVKDWERIPDLAAELEELREQVEVLTQNAHRHIFQGMLQE